MLVFAECKKSVSQILILPNRRIIESLKHRRIFRVGRDIKFLLRRNDQGMSLLFQTPRCPKSSVISFVPDSQGMNDPRILYQGGVIQSVQFFRLPYCGLRSAQKEDEHGKILQEGDPGGYVSQSRG